MSTCNLFSWARIGLLAAALALAATPGRAPAAEAVGKMAQAELAVEAYLTQAVLPGSTVGMLVINRCTGCPPLSFTATSRTLWLIGKEPVSFAALRAHAAKSPKADITAFYSKAGRELTRLRISER
jgi:hypothetical protein